MLGRRETLGVGFNARIFDTELVELALEWLGLVNRAEQALQCPLGLEQQGLGLTTLAGFTFPGLKPS